MEAQNKVQLVSFVKKNGRVWQQKGWGLELIEGVPECLRHKVDVPYHDCRREDRFSEGTLAQIELGERVPTKNNEKKDGVIDEEACSEDRSQQKGSKNKWEGVMHMNHIRKKMYG